jgi:3-deoxy-D-manno-oct-2-ulosonic acid (Kdo) hydroxylase
MLEVLDIPSWSGPFDAATRARAAAQLEAGLVLTFPRLSFALDEAEERAMRAAGDGSRKNISRDPRTGECRGSGLTGAALAALTLAMARYAAAAQGLVLGLVPDYAPGLTCGRTSLRPVEIATRTTSWRKDDKRLHVDAFPSRPQQGRRILRVFANVDPAGTPRVWRLGPEFEAFAAAFLPSLPRALPGQSWLLHRLGLTRSRRSRYDEIMLYLHDAAKRDLAWQRTAAVEEIAFPPGSVWMVFTDQVPHAALSGCNALEQTLYVAPEVLAAPARAPLAVLERLCGRALR